MKDRIWLEIKLEDITEIRKILPNEKGLDIRVRNYPYEDLSIETTKFNNVKELIEYLSEQETD